MNIKKLQNILTAIKRTFVGFVIFAPLSIIDDKYNYGDLFDPLNSLLSYVLPYVETTTGEFVICVFFFLLLTFFSYVIGFFLLSIIKECKLKPTNILTLLSENSSETNYKKLKKNIIFYLTILFCIELYYVIGLAPSIFYFLF